MYDDNIVEIIMTIGLDITLVFLKLIPGSTLQCRQFFVNYLNSEKMIR
jgi:hypothetical protein